MSYHVGVVSEGLATVVTFEGLVARVCPHMFLQGPGSTELLSAQLALYAAVVLRDHVLSGVGGQLGTVSETLITLVTSQVLISRVGGHVRDHLATRREDLVALVTLEGLVMS